MNTETVRAVAAIAAPLISREEHILGEKVLTLAYKWGEPVVVKIGAVGWKRLRQIGAIVDEQKLSHEDNLEMLMKESLQNGGQAGELPLNHLAAKSLAKLTEHCVAMSFGEAGKTDPNGLPAVMPATDGSKSAGEPGSNSSGQVTAPPK